MWGKNKQKSKGHQHSPNVQFDTLISGKTQIEGDLQFSGGLHIDGMIRGTIRAEEDSEAIVRISDIGEIDGDVIEYSKKYLPSLAVGYDDPRVTVKVMDGAIFMDENQDNFDVM